jgi:hypothetical protein
VKAPALLTRQPQPILDHPCPECLAAYLDVMLAEQDFGRQRRAEVRILGTYQLESISPDPRTKAMVRRLASPLVGYGNDSSQTGPYRRKLFKPNEL